MLSSLAGPAHVEDSLPMGMVEIVIASSERTAISSSHLGINVTSVELEIIETIADGACGLWTDGATVTSDL